MLGMLDRNVGRILDRRSQARAALRLIIRGLAIEGADAARALRYRIDAGLGRPEVEFPDV